MKRTAALAALAVLTVAGFAPATALSPQRALASAAARASGRASVPGGTLLWAARFHGNAQRNIPVAVAASPDGATVYVTGTTNPANSHFSTVAFNAATGAQRWAATFYGRGYSQPAAVAVSPDGSKVFVTGYTTLPGACCPDQFVTIAYDAVTGARLWVAHAFNIVHLGSVATTLAVSPDGSTVFAAGVAGKNPVLVAYDAATGAQRWLSRYQVPLGGGGTTEGVAVSPDGTMVFLTGSFRQPPAGPKFATVAYDAATGAQLWAQTAKGSTVSRDIAVSPNGSAVYVSGWVTQASGASVVTTFAYAAATGTPLWAKDYRGLQASNVANAITVSPDGSQVFLAGHTGGITLNSPAYFATVAYAAGNGTQLWARTHPAGIASIGGFTYGAIAIGASPDGTQVFITGTTPGFRNGSVNFTTIAYRAVTGAASWLVRYRGRRDFANAMDLAVSPAGQAVFVTGFIGVHDGCCDFGTVAYQP
jgi:DNA-binding beta-propeller fold protein YncE